MISVVCFLRVQNAEHVRLDSALEGLECFGESLAKRRQ